MRFPRPMVAMRIVSVRSIAIGEPFAGIARAAPPDY